MVNVFFLAILEDRKRYSYWQKWLCRPRRRIERRRSPKDKGNQECFSRSGFACRAWEHGSLQGNESGLNYKLSNVFKNTLVNNCIVALGECVLEGWICWQLTFYIRTTGKDIRLTLSFTTLGRGISTELTHILMFEETQHFQFPKNPFRRH